MKFLLVGILSILLAFPALASKWEISNVVDNGKTIGYIYHTGAKGTQTKGSIIEKSITGIRLVCAIQDQSSESRYNSIVAIFWNGLSGQTFQNINISVDNKAIKVNTAWLQDEQLLFQPVENIEPLIRGLKTGKLIRIEWEYVGIKRETMFDISQFNSRYNEYLNLCKQE